MKKPTDARLVELADILNDWDNTELGPIDRRQLREAVLELRQLREKPVLAGKADPVMDVRL